MLEGATVTYDEQEWLAWIDADMGALIKAGSKQPTPVSINASSSLSVMEDIHDNLPSA